MKKLLFLALAAIAAASCEGPVGPPGPVGPSGSANRKVLYLTVLQNYWDRIGNTNELNSYFGYTFNDVAELTNNVYKNGAVMAYVTIDPQTSYEALAQLPYTRYYGDEDAGGEFFWSTHYDYEYSPGMISFYVTPSDFITDQYPPTTTFRVVLMW